MPKSSIEANIKYKKPGHSTNYYYIIIIIFFINNPKVRICD